PIGWCQAPRLTPLVRPPSNTGLGPYDNFRQMNGGDRMPSRLANAPTSAPIVPGSATVRSGGMRRLLAPAIIGYVIYVLLAFGFVGYARCCFHFITDTDYSVAHARQT